MACCGSKRAQLSTAPGRRNDRPAPAAPAAPVQSVPAANSPSIALRYLRRDALSLRGPRTGRIYHADGTAALVLVHPDDAPALLRTGLFVADDPA